MEEKYKNINKLRRCQSSLKLEIYSNSLKKAKEQQMENKLQQPLLLLKTIPIKQNSISEEEPFFNSYKEELEYKRKKEGINILEKNIH